MLTKREKTIRKSIGERKPIAWNKIQRIPEQIKRGRSIALMQLQRSYSCNQVCEHCAISKFRKHIKKKDIMTIPEIGYVADAAHVYGLSSICLSGGEPLIFPDLEEIIDAIVPARFVLSMDTNGLLLTKEKIEWLVSKEIDRIHLSIDGLQDNHDQFRGSKGAWQHNIDVLPYCKEAGLGVVINIVATKNLIESREIEKQLEFIQKFGFHASLIYPKPVGSFEEAKNQVLNTKDMDYLETLTKEYNCSTHLTPAYGRDIGCLCFKRHFSCLPNGLILSCPWIPIHFGNVLEEGLETILQRGLSIPWFKWGNRMPCGSGNSDTYFYQNIISQIEKHKEYPVSYRDIDWHLEYFTKG